MRRLCTVALRGTASAGGRLRGRVAGVVLLSLIVAAVTAGEGAQAQGAPPVPQLARCTAEEPCVPEAGQLYVIRLEDTLATIAARFSTTPEALIALNPKLEYQTIVQRGGVLRFTEDGLLAGEYIILAPLPTALPDLPSRSELVGVDVLPGSEESVRADQSRPRSVAPRSREATENSGANAIVALVIIALAVLGVGVLGFQISRRRGGEDL
ncbi:MAG: LysM peptidoglycan-binding domain-containing protein [Chloroflexi bacterium]|nr:LysM peptidoglycan-binding domain-containing protein [Chloroflexota bacterium]